MQTHIIWFRRDLRITDNLALSAACADPDARVLAVYIATPEQWQQHHMSPRQAGLIFDALIELQRTLAERGIPLFYHQCATFSDSVDWLVQFCLGEKADLLFFNSEYEYNERCRDQSLVERLFSQVVCRSYHDSLLLAPGTVVTGDHKMFKVFTPFRRAFIKQLSMTETSSLPPPAKRAPSLVFSSSDLAPFDYPRLQQDIFPVGEIVVLNRLRSFCRLAVMDYHHQRDWPAKAATSQLSAYLAVGLLSPRQCFNRLLIEAQGFLQTPDSGAFCWFNELIWREFYRHLLVAYPKLCWHHPFLRWTDNILWRDDPEGLSAWKEGRTGYPIVDAAMRQLKTTGWMHNRLRMITASFLVKDLLIDWRLGEQYFMSQLTDGDFSANNGGWQWAASTGTDAVPYFRIFNPTIQGRNYDPDGVFVYTWVPELREVPQKWIHEPHQWRDRHNRQLGYPNPIVEHGVARQKTLAAFAAAKQNIDPCV